MIFFSKNTFSFLDNHIVVFIVALALFMDALDTTIINTAIPAMSHSLKVQPIDLKLALISYLLSLTLFIPISGWIGDKYGIKRTFISALSIFILSSLFCGLANSLLELIIARFCQGIGGSLMMPLGRLIILRTFPKNKVITAMNGIVMIVSIGLMLGPVLGGFITDHFSWHWIFWINIPVGLFAILVTAIYLKKMSFFPVHPFDFLGFLFFGGGLTTLTFGLADISEATADLKLDCFIILTSLLLLLSYFFHSFRQPYPIVNLKLFRLRTFQIAVLGNLFARLGFGGIPFLLPLLLQISLGYKAETAGLLLMPIAVGVLFVKLFSLQLLRYVGYKRLLIINTGLISLSLWAFSLITAVSSVYFISLSTFIFGFLISLQYSGMNPLAYSEIEVGEMSAATSIMSTVQQLSQSLGIAAGAILLTYFSHSLYNQMTLTVSVFHQTFFVMGLMTLLSSAIFLRLEPHSGLEMLS